MKKDTWGAESDLRSTAPLDAMMEVRLRVGKRGLFEVKIWEGEAVSKAHSHWQEGREP